MRPPILTRRTIFGLISGSGLLVAAVVFSATTPQSAHEATQQAENPARVASPYVTIKDEPPPTLFVDPPFPEPLARGIVQIQWRVENVRILPVFGKDALDVSPRVGHLHIHVDDLPWLWAHTRGAVAPV